MQTHVTAFPHINQSRIKGNLNGYWLQFYVALISIHVNPVSAENPN